MVVAINDLRVIITQVGGEKDRMENNKKIQFLDEVPRDVMRCSLKSGASGHLHDAGVHVIISSDVGFHRVAGTPCPSSEQIYSDKLTSASLIWSVHRAALICEHIHKPARLRTS